LLNLWIVKFFKAVLKVKDEAFNSYVIKKNLFKYIVDIFVENPNKSNLINSCILDLFEFLTKEYNKKIGEHLMQNYEKELLKNPLYERSFRAFVAMHDGKEESKRGIVEKNIVDI
jgi:protein phosphatase-4 regulatory subunit 3